MKKIAITSVALLGMALSGCATVFEGSSQKIALSTSPSGARCVLSNGAGKWSVVTPAHVNVERSKKDMKVRCTKDGYEPATATIPSDLETWTLANFLLLDLPGLGVDAATGAINSYPDTNTVHMQQGYNTQQQQPDAYPTDSYSAPVETPPSNPDNAPAYFDSAPPAPSYPDATQPYQDAAPPAPDSTQATPGTLPSNY